LWCYPAFVWWSAGSQQYQSIFGHSSGIQMVDLSVTCFAILRAVVASFYKITIENVVAGENAHNPYHDGHCIHALHTHTPAQRSKNTSNHRIWLETLYVLPLSDPSGEH
jgi:hypothetical protein